MIQIFAEKSLRTKLTVIFGFLVGVQETKKSLSKIDQITQSNAAQAQETSHAAHSLTDQVAGLNHALSLLKSLVQGKSEIDPPSIHRSHPSTTLR